LEQIWLRLQSPWEWLSRCHRGCHLHRHIHLPVAPPISSFSRAQVTPPTDSEFGQYICKRSFLVLLELVIACSLAETSRQLRFLPRLYATPLSCVDPCTHPPPVVSLVLGCLLWGQFDVQNRLLLSVF
jgi:hypothetical protein